MQIRRELGVTVLGLATLALISTCASDVSSSAAPGGTVTDTLGNRFDVRCGSGLCGLTPWDSDLSPHSCSYPPGNEAFVLVMDPLLSIYALRVPSTGVLQLDPTNPSRPVACTTDADCLAPGISTGLLTFTYACTNGLCRCSNSSCSAKDGNLMTYDVLTLCQADIPWPAGCPYVTSQPFASRISQVADLCGTKDTCAHVPASCRQPDLPVAPISDGGTPDIPAVDGGLSLEAGPTVDGGV